MVFARWLDTLLLRQFKNDDDDDDDGDNSSNRMVTIMVRRRRRVKSPSNNKPVGSGGHALNKTHLHFHLLELLHGGHLFGSKKFLRCCCVFGRARLCVLSSSEESRENWEIC